jgi:nitroreductase
MEFQDVIRKRKMVRSFEDRPVPHEVVERVLANAQKAPSAGFSQGWGFLVLEGKEETARYWDALWPRDRRTEWGWPDLFNAPLLIVCLSNKMQYLRRYAEPDKGWTDMDERRWPVPYWDIDTGMAALLMLLTAVDAGLGAVFFGVFDQAKLRATFGVPSEYTAVGVIAIGYPKPADRPSPSLRRGHRPAADVVRRGTWSGP